MTDVEFEELLAMKYAQDNDPEFRSIIEKLPAKYWARYDLSAVRLGWEIRKLTPRLKPTRRRAMTEPAYDGNGKNPDHYGPHCSGSCEGAAYAVKIRELEVRLTEKYAEIQRLKDESEMIHYKKALGSIAEGIIPWVEGCSEDPATVIMRYARTVLDESEQIHHKPQTDEEKG